jgi:hypothetical protein
MQNRTRSAITKQGGPRFHHVNFLALGSRDMFDANNKAVDYLYCALCQSEFDQVQTEDLACRIWEQLNNAHAENA